MKEVKMESDNYDQKAVLAHMGDLLSGVSDLHKNKNQENIKTASFLGKLLFEINQPYRLEIDNLRKSKELLCNFKTEHPDEVKLITFVESYVDGKVQHHAYIDLCSRILYGHNTDDCVELAIKLNHEKTLK